MNLQLLPTAASSPACRRALLCEFTRSYGRHTWGLPDTTPSTTLRTEGSGPSEPRAESPSLLPHLFISSRALPGEKPTQADSPLLQAATQSCTPGLVAPNQL